VVVEVGAVDEFSGLLADDFGQARVGVAEGGDADAGDKVEVFFALVVVKVDAFALPHDQRVASVALEDVVGFEFDEFVSIDGRVYGCCGHNALQSIKEALSALLGSRAHNGKKGKEQPARAGEPRG